MSRLRSILAASVVSLVAVGCGGGGGGGADDPVAIRGRLLDCDGSPTRARVALVRASGEAVDEGAADADGRFTLRAPAAVDGELELRGEKVDRTVWSHTFTRDGADVAEVALEPTSCP